MRLTKRNQTVMGVALAAGLACAPVAVAPPTAPLVHPASRSASPIGVLPGSNGAFGFPVFGRSELRLLISKRLKLVLDYRPTAYC